MPGEISCYACKRILATETARGETDQFGYGPYIDLHANVSGIRMYLSKGKESNLLRIVGMVCPNCGHVTYIMPENIGVDRG